MAKEDASYFLKLVGFFTRDYLLGYQLFIPKTEGKNCAVYRNFPEKNLSVVVYLPAITTDYGKILMIGKKAGTVLKVTKDMSYLFDLTDTVMSGAAWKDVVKEKVNALEELIEETGRCTFCTKILQPRLCQSKETGTWFVSTFCTHCRSWRNTEYGIGLKTRLHKFLKARHTQRRRNGKSGLY